ncbi:hypothetical protein CEXT_570421 [Caerostris extrusa]|uniref:Transposase n=1 Tax=Caerostris extrusa TaxID=172846 RepID=A0AAV4PPX4_CAEEX|nr:hypothetical protein CEXT_570421 [Caerostris extrusa]
MADEHSYQWPHGIGFKNGINRSHFITDSRTLMLIPMFAERGKECSAWDSILKWIRTVFMLREMIFTADGWWYGSYRLKWQLNHLH